MADETTENTTPDLTQFSSPTGWQKLIATAVGALASAGTTWGLAQTQVDDTVKIIGSLAPVALTVGFWIVNQVAAFGKAQNQQKLSQIAANQATQTGLIAAANAKGDVSAVNNNPAPIVEAGKAVVAPVVAATAAIISLVKDRVSAIRALVGAGKAYRDYLNQSIKTRIDYWVTQMLKTNPNYTTVEAIQAVVSEYFGVKLTSLQCSSIQAIMGLEPILHSMTDQLTLSTFYQAFDAHPLELAWLENIFREAAVTRATLEIIEEANSRVQAGDKDIAAARLALQEFEYSARDAAMSQWSGDRLMFAFRSSTGAGVGSGAVAGPNGSYEPFNPYAAAGYPELALNANLS